MDYQLAATKKTKKFAPMLAQKIRKKKPKKKQKRFVNPPMYDIPIKEDNGQVTIGAS